MRLQAKALVIITASLSDHSLSRLANPRADSLVEVATLAFTVPDAWSIGTGRLRQRVGERKLPQSPQRARLTWPARLPIGI